MASFVENVNRLSIGLPVGGIEEIVNSIGLINQSVNDSADNALIATQQATIATTKAGEALSSSDSASASETVATTKAGEALVSASNALTSENSASADASTATTQAGIATTKASEALSSKNSAETAATTATTKAVEASTSASNASNSEVSALTYKNLAQGYADSINPSLLVSSTEYSTHLSVPASYHIYNGQLSLSNTITTTGFSTKLYTGNGASQSITTGIDMNTQWGNLATEKFGGLIWTKSRGVANDHVLHDSIRGTTNRIYSNLTNANTVASTGLTAFNSDGFTLGSDACQNANTGTFVAWNFQTTHRVTGVTNHGKPYTCHYNPFTGFTIVKYEGSGLAGHEIPHYLGRKLGFVMCRNLSVVSDWTVQYKELDYLVLNTTAGLALNQPQVFTSFNNETSITGTSITTNTSTNQYILYGWANSYFDASNTLIGNYEVGKYQANATAGIKIPTRAKGALLLYKRIDAVGDWGMVDNVRGDNYLYANSSAVEGALDIVDFVNDGFILKGTYANVSGGTYMYMVIYDNDAGSGKSKYPRATDSSYLNLNALVPFAQGIDSKGTKNTILSKNEILSGLTFTEGKNYVYAKADGTYGVKPYAPQYNTYNGYVDYFDVNSNSWYSGISLFSDDFNTTDNWTANTSNGSGTTFSILNGKLTINRGTNEWGYGEPYKAINTVIGQKYRMVMESSSVIIGYSNSLGTNIACASGQIDFVAASTTTYIQLLPGLVSTIVSCDNFSIFPIKNDGTPNLSNATPITSRNYLDAIVYADAGGQVAYVEQLPKTEYKDIIKANRLEGKNACTAWAFIDGSSASPTILATDGFIVGVIKTSTGQYELIPKEDLDTTYLAVSGLSGISTADLKTIQYHSKNRIRVQLCTGSAYVDGAFSVHIDGGKN